MKAVIAGKKNYQLIEYDSYKFKGVTHYVNDKAGCIQTRKWRLAKAWPKPDLR
ncbi:MAG: hypothetical protein ABIE07_08070 [Candidatus Zixiibacteriota bacterium]